MNSTETANALRTLGFRVRSSGELIQAVKHFQDPWRLGQPLKIDGIVGPKTSSAIAASLAAHTARRGTLSTHFSYREFVCRCEGRFQACPRFWTRAQLVIDLERIREKYYPSGLSVKSGCRCTGHNKEVGGVTGSQHQYGTAADIAPKVSFRRLAEDRMVAGIGYKRSSGLVTHVDRRDIGGHDGTNGAPNRPTIWIYQS